MRISVFELLSRYILPSLRRILVETLWMNGLSESDIARRLNISRSLVSRYIRGERGHRLEIRIEHDVVEKIREIALKILSNEIDHYGVEEELMRIAIKLLSEKKLCIYHKKLEPDIDIGKCRICPKLFS